MCERINFRGLNVKKLVFQLRPKVSGVAEQVRLCADQNGVSTLVCHTSVLILEVNFAPRMLCAHRGRRLLSVLAPFFHFRRDRRCFPRLFLKLPLRQSSHHLHLSVWPCARPRSQLRALTTYHTRARALNVIGRSDPRQQTRLSFYLLDPTLESMS